MKRLVCLLLTLALLPCAAALADLDEWEYYYGDGYTIRYPDYMDAYGGNGRGRIPAYHAVRDPGGAARLV